MSANFATRRLWARAEPRATAGLSGVLAAAVSLGLAELVASVVGPGSSPVIAVGAAFIDLTPRPLKEFAIRTFGENDKTVLLAGVYTLLVGFAIGIGLLARQRRALGLAGIAAFGLIGVAAALTRPSGSPADTFPSLIGAVAGVLALDRLARTLPPPAASATVMGGEPGTDAEVRGEPGTGTAAGGEPGTGTVAGGEPGTGTEVRGEPGTGVEVDPRVGRRRFLVTGGVVLGVAAVAGGLGRALAGRFDVSGAREAITLPRPAEPAPALPADVDLRIPGLTPFTTRNADFYRVDTALLLPQVSPATWKLRIHGRVRKPLTLTFAELLRRELIERDITIACVSNEVGGDLAGTARWLGVPLKSLLDEVGPHDDADQIVSTSTDGWTCGTPTGACRDGRDAMLAVAMNGEPLPVEHGFPVRMIVPGLYGYVSATKWVKDLELSRFGDFDAYWVRRGWAAKAPIKTASRIDTPGGFAQLKRGTVTVAGVAWAQRRGISKVEVRVDRGPWQAATLAGEASIDTWRQWSWQWRATGGSHTIECRATDRTGAAQTGDRAAPFPDGATGWHSVVVTVG